MLIFKKMAAILSEVGAIGKDQQNKQQGFSYRGAEDVCNALHPLMAKHEVFVMPEVLEDKSEERQTKSGGVLIYRVLKIKYTFYTTDGSSVSAVTVGEGMDSGDKASNKAMTAAQKYCFVQSFVIASKDMVDPDSESHDELESNKDVKSPTPIKKQASNSSYVNPYAASQQAASNAGKKRYPISEAQLKRLFAINKKQFSQQELEDYVFSRWGLTSLKDMVKAEYDTLVELVQSGTLGLSSPQNLPYEDAPPLEEIPF